MTIERSVYSTEDLLGVMRELLPVPTFWRRFFPGTFFSERETLEWSQIPGRRRLAPFALPTTPGEPVWGTEEDLFQAQPAYIKALDPVSATGFIRRIAGFGELGQLRPMTPQERYLATIAAILQEHRNTIERRWEWMCARALIDGEITIVDSRYPSRTVTFRRAANHTVVLAGNARFDQANVDIPEVIETYINRMVKARFGAAPSDMIMGADVWTVVRKNEFVRKLLDQDVRGTVANIDIGLGDGQPYQFRGSLSRNLNLWTYWDVYEEPDGTEQKYLGDKEFVLVAPPAAIGGVRAFGAIQDISAQLQALAIFSKMWDEENPSATMVMSQSAPLMVPMNPNATMKVTALT